MTVEVTVMEHTEASSELVPATYRYRGPDLSVIWQTSVPRDDEAAIAYFHSVVRFGPNFKPVYVERITRDESGEHYTMLKEMFDPELMQTKPFKVEI